MFASTASRSARTSPATRLRQIVRQIPQQQQPRMAYSGTTFKLNTGADIPAIGFGTWQDKDVQEPAVTIALKAGYRHIDTARIYGTEAAVGNAIKKSGIPREELFITSKLWNNSHHPDDVEKAIDASLKDLQTSYLDLYLMHWPSPFARSDELIPKDSNGKIRPGNSDYVDTYKAMEQVLRAGKTRAIGVSNFSKAELQRLIQSTSIVPAVHQIELHPYLQQHSFTHFHTQNHIHITHYSPLGNQNEIYDAGKAMRKLIHDPVLVDIANKHGKTGAHVALAWGIAQGHSVIPKSKTESRIKANLEGDFALPREDVERIAAMDKKLRFNDPSENFGWVFYKDLEGKRD